MEQPGFGAESKRAGLCPSTASYVGCDAHSCVHPVMWRYWCQSARRDNSSGARLVSLVEAVVVLTDGHLPGCSVRGGPALQILLGFKSSELSRA